MQSSFRLGDWLVQPHLDCLVRDDENIKLEPKVMKVFVYLAEHAGEVASKEKIFQDVWEGAFVTDEVLANAVWEIRKALGDDAKKPRFIQTVPKKGYRLIAPVTIIGDDRRLETHVDESPYPGLAPFSQEDARFFFGRDEEIEEVWEKIRKLHLLAIVGSSGAGKTSFVRAGLTPARPEGWGVTICHPGDKPFESLAQTLLKELGDDANPCPKADDPASSLAALDRWRKAHSEVLLVIDQFEELFTLNPEEVQAEFAELVGHAAQDLDVHVLICLRDDFFIHCKRYLPLAPVFKEVTPLLPPTGPSLRKALVSPAEKCGFRFEGEALVAEMLAEVTRERGALPLLAFAVARLWAKRDRERKLLTREAYLEGGGVAGAIAQHAEATLDQIGVEREPVVREVFRNLVTAKGTRVARDKDELLTVFEDSEAAQEVLGELINARLLTSFEIPKNSEAGSEQGQRVEVIHESLLKTWPRLVRWQGQDEDSAQLRDQLRQAAQLWLVRGRPADLLWAGKSLREFQVWRENYPGGLTTTEEAFSGAMVQHSERRKRRRRLALASVVLLLVGGMSVITALWRRSEQSLRLSEASRVLALGQLVIDDDPTAAIAYSIASLELADTRDTRQFVMEALWRGPLAVVMKTVVPDLEKRTAAMRIAFSPDGEWFAAAGFPGNVQIRSADGQTCESVAHFVGEPEYWPEVRFEQNSELLLSGAGKTIRFWSVPEAREVQTLEFEFWPEKKMLPKEFTMFEPVGSQLFTFNILGEGRVEGEYRVSIQSRPLKGGESRTLGHFDASGWGVSPTGKRLAYATGSELKIIPAEEMSTVRTRLVGRHKDRIRELAWASDGERIASRSESGEVRIWSLAPGSEEPLRVFGESDTELALGSVRFGREGALLATRSNQTVHLWDLLGPPDSGPLILRRHELLRTLESAFHPNGKWLAVANMGAVAFWPLSRAYPHVLREQSDVLDLVFTGDGNRLASISGDKLRLWPMSSDAGATSQILLEGGLGNIPQMQLDAANRRLLLAGDSGKLWVVPLDKGHPWALPTGFSQNLMAVALGPQCRMVATSIMIGPTEEKVIRVLNLESGEVQVFGPPAGAGDGTDGTTWDLEFTPDGRLLSAGPYGLLLWNLKDERFEVVDQGPWVSSEVTLKLSPDGRFVSVLSYTAAETSRRELKLYDLNEDASRIVYSHGYKVRSVAFDPTSKLIITGNEAGEIRVGPVNGGEPHLLLGHEAMVSRLAVSPDGLWLASYSRDNTIRIWPMPKKGQPPFHSLPHEELLERLRALTNLRAVPDEESSSRYGLDIAPFPGWETIPEW